MSVPWSQKKHCIVYRGCPKKRTFRMLLEPQCTGSITTSRHPLCLEIVFLVVSYYWLSRIKRSQAMFRGKIGPTALNFGYDFVLLVHFLGPVVRTKLIILAISGPFGAPQTQKWFQCFSLNGRALNWSTFVPHCSTSYELSDPLIAPKWSFCVVRSWKDRRC